MVGIAVDMTLMSRAYMNIESWFYISAVGVFVVVYIRIRPSREQRVSASIVVLDVYAHLQAAVALGWGLRLLQYR